MKCKLTTLLVLLPIMVVTQVQAQSQPSLGGLLGSVLDKAKGTQNSAPVQPSADPAASKRVPNSPAIAAAASLAGSVADPRYTISPDGHEVTDSKTGLTWRRCAEGMNWTGTTCSGQLRTFNGLSRVLAYEKTLKGWRVPKIDELLSISRLYATHENAKVGAGGTDAVAFPELPTEPFWSSTLYYKDRGDRDRTKTVNFNNGGEGFHDNGEPAGLLLVRVGAAGARAAGTTTTGGAVNAPTAGVAVVPAEAKIARPASGPGGVRFVVSADSREVTDTTTGLIWRRCAEGMSASGGGCVGKALKFDFAGAQSRATAQAKATRTSWRLPDKDELLSIGDEKRFKMAIDTTAFPGTPPDHFWTSHRIDSTYVYAVNFYNGFHYDRYQTSEHYVRLVREAK
jgi:Protein of unknown function (DUF1566)